MGKHLFIVLGNGFTYDFISYLGIGDRIDVQNLFRFGAEVPWPATDTPGFLSFKHCPNLWNLGARPHCQPDECMGLIEDIITCINAYASKPAATNSRALHVTGRPKDIYLNAYKELSVYLRSLFVWYNDRIDQIPDEIDNWGWAKYIKWANESDKYSKITIVTYNYDVWLERVLTKLGVRFGVGLFEPSAAGVKINILKPHGSISFCHKQTTEKSAFAIQLNRDVVDGDIGDFNVKYADLDQNYLVNPIVPPAGESGRLNHTWAGKIRKSCKEIAASLSGDDEMIICGISYWHVDRAELDELLNGCDQGLNIRLVNPKPGRTFVAVLTSIFENFIAFPSTKALEQYIDETPTAS